MLHVSGSLLVAVVGVVVVVVSLCSIVLWCLCCCCVGGCEFMLSGWLIICWLCYLMLH